MKKVALPPNVHTRQRGLGHPCTKRCEYRHDSMSHASGISSTCIHVQILVPALPLDALRKKITKMSAAPAVRVCRVRRPCLGTHDATAHPHRSRVAQCENPTRQLSHQARGFANGCSDCAAYAIDSRSCVTMSILSTREARASCTVPRRPPRALESP